MTLPMQPPGSSRIRGKATETYCVCLDCGRKFPYSWEKMKIVRRKSQDTPAAAAPRQPGWFSRHRWSWR